MTFEAATPPFDLARGLQIRAAGTRNRRYPEGDDASRGNSASAILATGSCVTYRLMIRKLLSNQPAENSDYPGERQAGVGAGRLTPVAMDLFEVRHG